MKNNKIRKTLSILMVLCMLASFAACSKKKKTEETTTAEPTPTPIPVETTTAPTTALSEFSGPDTNAAIENMTWSETEMEPTTMYVTTADDYLNVRRGPDANAYPEVVSKLPRGTAVTVVASTSNGWYKTSDGYYITGTYLSTSPV